MKKTAPERNVRQLLRRIGIGQFNATMVIPYMFIAPATTDPKASQIVLLVQHLQNALNVLGARVQMTGYLDPPTAAALRKIVGAKWMQMSWSVNVGAVLDAIDAQGNQPANDELEQVPDGSGLGDFGLPDVPGGLVTYGIIAYFLYRHFTRHKRA